MDTATSGNLPDSATSADYIYDGFDLWEFNFTNFTNISGSRWRDGDPGEEGEREEGDLWREIPLGIVLTFLCLLTTVGNILVLHAVRTEKRLQSARDLRHLRCTPALGRSRPRKSQLRWQLSLPLVAAP
nr:hypothetical protein BaRGS_031903 [Batillaria attramentaria]